MINLIVDYKRSLLALISSVSRHFGVNTDHATLPEMDELLTKNYKNVVVMLFDGLGSEILERHLSEESFLRRHMNGSVSSVFPPTTTAATRTMESGLSPIEHGWLGWNLYFDELGETVSIFPNTIPGTNGKKAADYHVATRFLPHKTIFEKIREARHEAYCVSPYAGYKLDSVSDICENVRTLCESDAKKYIYTYWPQPDYDMHDYGTNDTRVNEHIRDIDRCVEALAESISDTLIVVTADHGLVDIERWINIYDYPSVSDCLDKVPSIEARAMSFFVKDGMKDRFEHEFNRHFGEYYKLMSHDGVMSSQLFGDGVPNPKSESFIGDYIGIARGNVGLDVVTSNSPFAAAHAGGSKAEMSIPFIVIER